MAKKPDVLNKFGSSRAASLFDRRENQPPRQYLHSKNKCNNNRVDRPIAWGQGPFSRRNPKNLTFRAPLPRRVRSRLPPPAKSRANSGTDVEGRRIGWCDEESTKCCGSSQLAPPNASQSCIPHFTTPSTFHAIASALDAPDLPSRRGADQWRNAVAAAHETDHVAGGQLAEHSVKARAGYCTHDGRVSRGWTPPC